ncbi:MAG: flagellar biosynthesis protein FliQ [Gammaproteobacteria bacterium]
MTPDTIITLGEEALKITTLLSAPMLLSVLAVGLLVGVFQAVTSINEMTLSFIPKLIVLAVVLMLTGSWMLQLMMSFMRHIFNMIPQLIG